VSVVRELAQAVLVQTVDFLNTAWLWLVVVLVVLLLALAVLQVGL
jgi:hypothetical protein